MIKTGVIGVGNMGRNHARVYSELSDLVAVCDSDPARAKEVADRLGCDAYSDVDEFLDRSGVEALTVATPTIHHKVPVIKALELGMDVLIEKPISDTVENAQEIISAADRSGRTLSVGMIERHNPIVKFTKEIVENGTIGDVINISTKRVSSYPARITDVGVVTDIAVHDIDAVRYLSGSEVVSVYALGGSVRTRSLIDHATILLELERGMQGSLEVSWLTPMKLREISITGTDGIADMDYMDQEVKVSKAEFGRIDYDNLWRIPINYGINRMRISPEEPLRKEIADFLGAIVEGRAPLVTGLDGLKNLEIAKAAERSIVTGSKITLE
ncbi:MAG: Gfo/Idh/MocA family oxidoreductase [Candidatus Thermoplasmatota archaeon]|nr:Gfo/Idh/MocA family oxidoreductase [Candidatus Thermoplasmatota archaeon]